MRASIEELGGEFRFESKVDDIEIENGQAVSYTHLTLPTTPYV